ncbi:MAG TPA: tryptophan 2,3-dioxygenase family protein [Phycisphaerae bacterium]
MGYLTYSDYINDIGIIEALRVPPQPPAGQSPDCWPCWHRPDQAGAGVAWEPGGAWPRQQPWAHDEVLFIRTHQAFEVWFAVIVHELEDVMIRAAEVLGRHRVQLKQIKLAERDAVSPLPIEEFPSLQQLASQQSNPRVRDRILRMHAPGRQRSHTRVHVDWFAEADLDLWSARVRRAALTLRTTVPFFEVLATMTPAQFMVFRGRLVPASGFGSGQFREVELLCGQRERHERKLRPRAGVVDSEPHRAPLPEGVLRPGPETPAADAGLAFYTSLPDAMLRRVAAQAAAPGLRDLVYSLLSADGLIWPEGDDTAQRRDFDQFVTANLRHAIEDWRKSVPTLQAGGESAEKLLSAKFDELDQVLADRETIVAALLQMRALRDPREMALAAFLEACLTLDDALLHWRDVHIRFVERMIGFRPGTGGGGVNYLRRTVAPDGTMYIQRSFPCLWQARSVVQPA